MALQALVAALESVLFSGFSFSLSLSLSLVSWHVLRADLLKAIDFSAQD